MIRKHGFIIDNEKIYDSQSLSYKLDVENIDGNLIYFMVAKGYKRLYMFEPLLDFYTVDKVLRILKHNSSIVKSRDKEANESLNVQMSNMSMIYNYPPTYLTSKKFQYYKICQELKQKLL